MKGKRKEGEKMRTKDRKKSIRGRSTTKSFTSGKKDIFSPNLYSTYYFGEKNNCVKKGGGEEYDFFGKYIPLHCTLV